MTHNVLLRTLHMRYDQRTTILRKKRRVKKTKYTAETHQRESALHLSRKIISPQVFVFFLPQRQTQSNRKG